MVEQYLTVGVCGKVSDSVGEDGCCEPTETRFAA